MRENGKSSPRMRGRKGRSNTPLPSTVSDQRDFDEIKVHRSLRPSLLHLLHQFRTSIRPKTILIVLLVLFVVSITWMGADRLVIFYPHAHTTTKEERIFPRYVRHLDEEHHHKVNRLDLNMELYPSKRRIYISPEALEAQEHLWNGAYYRRNKVEEFETDECKAQYDWQLTSFPTCNKLYEFDLTNLHASSKNDEQVRLIANGYWRDVWMVKEQHSHTKQVLKSMRYEHEFVARNYDRHRRDAVAMERLAKSPLVVDIYGFCGNSGLFEFADGGDISNKIWPTHHQQQNMTKLEKLEIATQVSMGVTVMHNIDKEGVASIAHTDITPGQFIHIDGLYKLNDFNRARFIRWNVKKNEPCGYRVGNNPGTNRAPEEYRYQLQSEKVDIYSMGNIFYMLLTSAWPFEDISDDEKAQKMVADGKRPTFLASTWNSNDPIDITLKEAMMMCHEQHPKKRATAREVEALLKKKLLELKPNAIQEWGHGLT